jgi:transcriptional regulatory protein RtcR
MARKLVVFGFLGTTLDLGGGPKRWERWRPTVALTQQEDLLVARLELFHGREGIRLAKDITADIALTSPETKVELRNIDLRDAWDFETVYGALYEFARTYPFDVEREDYLVHITTGSHVVQICLFLLTESRHIPGRLVQTSPTGKLRDKVRKPEGSYAVIDLDLSKYDALAKRFHREKAEGLSVLKSGIKTQNERFNRLIEEVEHVAVNGRAPVLLLGSTGSGKSKLAKRIYELKKARHQVAGELAEVNCATLRGDAAMSMLFGHKKGAFTGAVSDRPGLLRKADKGVLFLDEVAELGLDEQAMLLRALEERVFYPMGSDKQVSSDFQLITGTNRDLKTAALRGEFRADLFARINLWTFTLPNLCDRTEDLEPNLDFELEAISRALGTQFTMNREARTEFLTFAKSFAWPGNFRDFNAAIVRMATFAKGGRITALEVKNETKRQQVHGTEGKRGTARVDEVLGKEAAALDRFDRVQLEDVLAVCAQAKTLSDAGRMLFAFSRTSKTSHNDTDRLKKYLARFGLDFQSLRKG